MGPSRYSAEARGQVVGRVRSGNELFLEQGAAQSSTYTRVRACLPSSASLRSCAMAMGSRSADQVAPIHGSARNPGAFETPSAAWRHARQRGSLDLALRRSRATARGLKLAHAPTEF